MIDGEINYLYLKIIINIYLILRKINLKKWLNYQKHLILQ
jgi:hypothetical protein